MEGMFIVETSARHIHLSDKDLATLFGEGHQLTNKKDLSDTDLKDIKETLGAGNISTNKSSTSLVDVSIVIGKDF